MNRKNVALVLSTGGARGIGHIGVIEELVNQGYNISSISGCSIGALIGAAYSTGTLDKCKRFLLQLNKIKTLRLADFNLSSKGILKGNKIMKIVKNIIPDINIEDLPIPLSIIAMDISNHKEVIFESGSLHDAIRASISLPIIFQPFEKDGKKYVDGGIINPLPLNRVQRTMDDLLIAVIAGASDTSETESSESQYKWNMFALLMESVTLLVQKIIQCSIEQTQPDIIISAPNKKFGIIQFYKSSEMIERGRVATRNSLLDYAARADL